MASMNGRYSSDGTIKMYSQNAEQKIYFMLEVILCLHLHRASRKICLTAAGIEPTTLSARPMLFLLNYAVKSVRVYVISELSRVPRIST